MSNRKSISKKTRFEVFKRDNFTCQYCGKKAPEVVLEIEHINPVSKGGDNNIMNLVAACQACNDGKAATPLSDMSAVEKQRRQIEELSERREQLEMMMQWRTGLRSNTDEATEKVCAYWSDATGGSFSLNAKGKKGLKKLLRDFSLQEVLDAIDIAEEQYFVQESGKITQQSVEHGFGRLGGICKNRRYAKENPEEAKTISSLYYIRGIARKNCGYFQDREAMAIIKEAHARGVSIEQLTEIAKECRNWTAFCRWTREATPSEARNN